MRVEGGAKTVTDPTNVTFQFKQLLPEHTSFSCHQNTISGNSLGRVPPAERSFVLNSIARFFPSLSPILSRSTLFRLLFAEKMNLGSIQYQMGSSSKKMQACAVEMMPQSR
jgi:hypothetical protein